MWLHFGSKKHGQTETFSRFLAQNFVFYIVFAIFNDFLFKRHNYIYKPTMKKDKRFRQGIFNPTNPKKYVCKNNPIYRSGW